MKKSEEEEVVYTNINSTIEIKQLMWYGHLQKMGE